MGQLSRAGLALAVLATVAGCSVARPLRPLAAGDLAVEMSLPATWLDNESTSYPVAAPLIGARYGLVENLELRGNLHVGAFFSEVVGVDFGAVWHGPPTRGWVPAFHLSGDLNLFTKPDQYGEGFGESNRGAMEIGLTAHWEPLAWLWPYAVFESVLLFHDGSFLANAMAGVQFWPREVVAISVEIGWLALNQPTEQWTEPYVGIDGQGAIYFGVGLEYRGSFLNRDAADDEEEEEQ